MNNITFLSQKTLNVFNFENRSRKTKYYLFKQIRICFKSFKRTFYKINNNGFFAFLSFILLILLIVLFIAYRTEKHNSKAFSKDLKSIYSTSMKKKDNETLSKQESHINSLMLEIRNLKTEKGERESLIQNQNMTIESMSEYTKILEIKIKEKEQEDLRKQEELKRQSDELSLLHKKLKN